MCEVQRHRAPDGRQVVVRDVPRFREGRQAAKEDALVGKEGWDKLHKRCPHENCAGELLGKALGARSFAVKCVRGDFEKRGTVAEITAWLAETK